MGTGIGKNCERCGEQLTYDKGFVEKGWESDYDLCKKCHSIYEFDKKSKESGPN